MGNVTVNDCNITDNYASFGGAIFVSKGTTATLNNCNVYNNDSSRDYGILGAIYVEDVGATVNVNGGEIYDNDAGIYLWGSDTKGSKANLNGVYVHDNDSYGVRADGNDNGNPVLTITGNTIIKNNSTETTSGPRINLRVNNSNNAKVAFTSPLGENASIGITLTGNDKGIFTEGWSTYMEGKNPADYFFTDNPNYLLYLKDGEVYVGLIPVASISNGTTVTEYSNFNDALAAWTDGTTLTLLDNVNFNGQATINDTKILDLNGYGIITTSNDSLFLINNGGNLTLNDSGNTTHYFTYERYKMGFPK
jgi:hypothetical protein